MKRFDSRRRRRPGMAARARPTVLESKRVKPAIQAQGQEPGGSRHLASVEAESAAPVMRKRSARR